MDHADKSRGFFAERFYKESFKNPTFKKSLDSTLDGHFLFYTEWKRTSLLTKAIFFMASHGIPISWQLRWLICTNSKFRGFFKKRHQDGPAITPPKPSLKSINKSYEN